MPFLVARTLQPEDCIQTVYKRGTASSQRCASRTLLESTLSPGWPSHPSLLTPASPSIWDKQLPMKHLRLSNSPNSPASILARDSVFILSMRGLTAQQIGQTLHATSSWLEPCAPLQATSAFVWR